MATPRGASCACIDYEVRAREPSSWLWRMEIRARNQSLTPWLTGTGSRRLEGTNIGHQNREAMAYVGVRVEPPVKLVNERSGSGLKRLSLCGMGGLEMRWDVTNR